MEITFKSNAIDLIAEIGGHLMTAEKFSVIPVKRKVEIEIYQCGLVLITYIIDREIYKRVYNYVKNKCHECSK